MYSRHARHIRRPLLLLAAPALTIVVSFLLLLVPRTALAAAPHVDTMLLNSSNNLSLPGTFYSFMLDPNVVFLLFVVAMIGIFLEIAHPGAIVPGAVGGIALILFLIAIASLSFNWVGLVLMFLAFALLIIDLRASTHGLLTVGSVAALVAGALLLFNDAGSNGIPAVDPVVVYVMGGFVGVLGIALINVIARSQHKPVTTGPEGMIGARAITLTPLTPEGRVRYGGEDWSAVQDGPAASIDADSEVQIIGIEGLRLHVRSTRNQEISSTQSVTPFPSGADE